MYIEEIKLKNFRNYNNQEIKLKNGINLFYGNNAQGKTNIIESIFLCSMGKSFRARRDKELIKFDENNSNIEIKYTKNITTAKIGNAKNLFVTTLSILSDVVMLLRLFLLKHSFTTDSMNKYLSLIINYLMRSMKTLMIFVALYVLL